LFLLQDSIEEKTDLSELIYNQDLLKNEQFDIDLNVIKLEIKIN